MHRPLQLRWRAVRLLLCHLLFLPALNDEVFCIAVVFGNTLPPTKRTGGERCTWSIRWRRAPLQLFRRKRHDRGGFFNAAVAFSMQQSSDQSLEGFSNRNTSGGLLGNHLSGGGVRRRRLQQVQVCYSIFRTELWGPDLARNEANRAPLAASLCSPTSERQKLVRYIVASAARTMERTTRTECPALSQH